MKEFDSYLRIQLTRIEKAKNVLSGFVSRSVQKDKSDLLIVVERYAQNLSYTRTAYIQLQMKLSQVSPEREVDENKSDIALVS